MYYYWNIFPRVSLKNHPIEFQSCPKSIHSGTMIFLLLATTLFLLAFVFLLFSHEFLKKQIRRISAKRWDEPDPYELDYPFFRIPGPPPVSAPWKRFSRTETQIADRNDFIRKTAPELVDRFILQEQILRLMLGAVVVVLVVDDILGTLKFFGVL